MVNREMEDNYESGLVDALKEVVVDCTWQRIGVKNELSKRRCQIIYAEDGEDLVLIYIEAEDKFYAMDSVCSHEGGPLDMGDIEELAGNWFVICPWHSFEFDVQTGQNSFGLSQNVYEVKQTEDDIYVNCSEMLSLNPFQNSSSNSESFTGAQAKAKALVKKMRHPEKDCNKTLVNEILTTSDEQKTSKLSLVDWAILILKTADPDEKVRLTFEVSQLWNSGALVSIETKEKSEDNIPPDTPCRLENLTVIKPEKMKRGKGGTLGSRISLLHSLANIEQWAVDLSWDILARFAEFAFNDGSQLPSEFFTDFVKVACDEAKHYDLLNARLLSLGSHFGALPVHNALWQSAHDTRDSLLARLAIVHMVHEARGLDVHPKTKQRFEAQKDMDSVQMLDVIFKDEITHVQAGLKWFTYVCNHQTPQLDPVDTFHQMVKRYFQGYLKPPFNTLARETAGMTEEWYLPLVKS